MNLRLIVGFGIAIISFILSMQQLHQEASNFFDWVALFVVLGGTLSVSIVTLQPQERSEALFGLWRLIRGGQPKSTGALLRSCLQWFDEENPSLDPKFLSHQILINGRELIDLGLTSERIHTILQEKIGHRFETRKKAAQSIRSLAKYPPAFGLMGTVLGLVELMRALAAGLDPKETGLKMAVALVATLYGLILANLVINPLGESILKEAHTERDSAGISLRTVLLFADQATRVESIELLNAFAQPGEELGHQSAENASQDSHESSDQTEAQAS